jgi:dipeptidyl aminopeptidase/acylaminoacyl peptidase
VAESTTLPGPDGRDVHAHIYPPRNPDHTGPPGTRPPYVVFVHGGPTSHSAAKLDLAKAYLTSRGIGVLDVNYGGSTGFGRAYRQRLTGQWGVVDVADATAAAAALVERGDADPARLAIRGGSAGGWTTLCAVTGTDRFVAGTSLFGVADVRRLAATTHDFESRYLQTLVGPDATGPGPDLRSPLPRAGTARCPVLLLQGADDPVVPVEQAEAFRDALVAAGLPHALLIFPGEQHGFRKADSIVAAAEAELSFYGQVMGFTPPGIPMLPLIRPAG